MQTKSAWKAGLGLLSSGVGAMQTCVVLPGVLLLPATPDFGGRGTEPTPI